MALACSVHCQLGSEQHHNIPNACLGPSYSTRHLLLHLDFGNNFLRECCTCAYGESGLSIVDMFGHFLFLKLFPDSFYPMSRQIFDNLGQNISFNLKRSNGLIFCHTWCVNFLAKRNSLIVPLDIIPNSISIQNSIMLSALPVIRLTGFPV